MNQLLITPAEARRLLAICQQVAEQRAAERAEAEEEDAEVEAPER